MVALLFSLEDSASSAPKIVSNFQSIDRGQFLTKLHIKAILNVCFIGGVLNMVGL